MGHDTELREKWHSHYGNLKEAHRVIRKHAHAIHDWIKADQLKAVSLSVDEPDCEASLQATISGVTEEEWPVNNKDQYMTKGERGGIASLIDPRESTRKAKSS
ncbi:hypothetical protein A8A54_11020 [Brucella pseudogrignonensis]|nr:hypothetical protein A8A54_11020 [Brucella pseudogrignonensis]